MSVFLLLLVFLFHISSLRPLFFSVVHAMDDVTPVRLKYSQLFLCLDRFMASAADCDCHT